ncbi:MAG: hypothetical protein EA390_11200 [Balneolaceae bacterium]|nr:MAG: hypothetical protein EA390_11200 [Balneolaceae bacterium]
MIDFLNNFFFADQLSKPDQYLISSFTSKSEDKVHKFSIYLCYKWIFDSYINDRFQLILSVISVTFLKTSVKNSRQHFSNFKRHMIN